MWETQSLKSWECQTISDRIPEATINLSEIDTLTLDLYVEDVELQELTALAGVNWLVVYQIIYQDFF